jgi:hypothetical protein
MTALPPQVFIHEMNISVPMHAFAMWMYKRRGEILRRRPDALNVPIGIISFDWTKQSTKCWQPMRSSGALQFILEPIDAPEDDGRTLLCTVAPGKDERLAEIAANAWGKDCSYELLLLCNGIVE